VITPSPISRSLITTPTFCNSAFVLFPNQVQQWLDAPDKSRFCKSLGLSWDAMRSIKQQRDAFARDLAGLGFVNRGGGGGSRGDLNANGNSDRAISAVRLGTISHIMHGTSTSHICVLPKSVC
jgi:hypothetical protein